MAIIKDTTTDANGNIIVNVSSSADDAITLATAGTYSDKNIIFNMTFDTPFKPAGKSYLMFSSPNSFTLKVYNTTKHWNGTLEYFNSNKTWSTWNGTTTLSSIDNDGEHVLYLRGTRNTVITGSNSSYKWVLTGSDIACIGNIENLLDYATVESGAHPTMANYCYYYMFRGCTSLTHAPALPATTLASNCYASMFSGCTSLTQAPALPATTLARSCYDGMFNGCTALTQAPFLPATTLADYCYYSMFSDCTSLTQAPSLPATTLASNCYRNMFSDCTSLTQAPALPATTLASGCYEYMFKDCTALTQVSALPATTLAENCYNSMFFNCTSLTHVPSLPATTLAENCYQSMFYQCTSIKLSSTQTDEYTQGYRIPTTGIGTTASNALNNMFTGTGGTFTGEPEINTTYYISSNNMIVHDTEIATLREYVGSISAPASHASDETIHVTADQKTSWDAKATTTYVDQKISEIPTPDASSIIEQNKGLPQKFWRGTHAEYDAVETKSDDTMYIITDDEGIVEAPGDMQSSVYDTLNKQTDIFQYADQKIANTEKGAANGVATLGADGKVPFSQLPSLDYVPTSEKGKASGVATLGTDGKVPFSQLPEISSVKTYTTTIGTTWTMDDNTGVKSQAIHIEGILAKHTAKVDHAYTGDGTTDSYAAFVEAENQYLTYITNGYAETYDGGITFYIFGDAPTVSIPIVVEVS